jgi:hypothetical protein
MIEDTVVFIHLFKCAGTALIAPILQNYKVGDNDFTARYNLNIVAGHPENYYSFCPERQEKIRFISGHIQDDITFNYIRKMKKQPYILITLLRDPIDRAISQYYYIRQDKSHRHRLHNIFKEVSFSDVYNRDLYKNYDPKLGHTMFELAHNYQTRILSGTTHFHRFHTWVADNPDQLELDESHLERAITNLKDNFSFVTIQEHIDEGWTELAPRFGWSYPIDYFFDKETRPNVTDYRPIVSEVPEEILEAIRKENKLDIQLYNWVKEEGMKLINNRPIVRITQ